ncbi:MAG: STAS domain-containing protein [Firmicutes bacterium]|nr:STAS domain-containing protein [Bacillota bacterium]
MNIVKDRNGSEMKLALEGRLDTLTAPKLEDCLNAEFPGLTDLVFDMKDIEYVSSAGLRVLLMAQKKMNAQGGMKVVNVNDTVMEIFELTGFADLLNIE